MTGWAPPCWWGATSAAARVSPRRVVGAPGEDVRSGGRDRVDAGTVLVAPLTAAAACPPRYDDQSNRLAGARRERTTGWAPTLGLGRVRDDHDDETGDHVFVAVPGEDRGTVAGAGIVVSTAVGGGAGALRHRRRGAAGASVGFTGGAVAGPATAASRDAGWLPPQPDAGRSAHQPGLVGDDHQLGAVAGAELAHRPADVGAGGRRG